MRFRTPLSPEGCKRAQENGSLRLTSRFHGLWLLGLAVVGLGLSGCGPDKILVGGTRAPKQIRTAVSLAPGASEMVAQSGVALLGRTESDDFPPIVKQSPVVMNGVHPDFEKIVSLKPDLVVYDKDLTSEADLAKFKELKLDTFGFGGDTIDDYIKDQYRYAALVGKETMTTENVRRIKKAVATSESDPVTPKPKVAILLPFAGGNPMIAGSKSFYADLIRAAGAEPVGPDSNKFVTISFEQLTQLNPDAIIVGGAKGDFSALTSSPTLSSLRAVKTQKYFGLDPSLLERRGSRVDQAVSKLHEGLKTLFKS